MINNPLLVDPSRTGQVRRSLRADLFSRLDAVKKVALGFLFGKSSLTTADVRGFRLALIAAFERVVFPTEWYRYYVALAYTQGVHRTVTESGRGGERDAVMERVGSRKLPRRKGKPTLLLNATSTSPARTTTPRRTVSTSSQRRDAGGRFFSEKVATLSERLETELRGMTQDAVQKMSKELLTGIERGYTPRTIASAIRRVIQISRSRATTIARTEIVRAQAEGQLDTMEELGVDQLQAMVEWETDGTPCPLCKPLEGVTFTLDEARGMLPRHPNCRCAWSIKRGEELRKARTTKRDTQRAVAKSKRLGGKNDDWEPAADIAPRKPLGNTTAVDTELIQLVGRFEDIREDVS